MSKLGPSKIFCPALITVQLIVVSLSTLLLMIYLRYLTKERKFGVLLYRAYVNTVPSNSYSAMPAKTNLVLITYLPEKKDFLP